MDANGAKVGKTLLDSHHSLLVEVPMVLYLTEKHVRCGTLDSIVELEFPQTLSGLAHPIVRPFGVLGTMEVVVVVDVSEALLQDSGVEQGVERVTRHREGIDLARHHTCILLTGQVLYTSNQSNHIVNAVDTRMHTFYATLL